MVKRTHSRYEKNDDAGLVLVGGRTLFFLEQRSGVDQFFMWGSSHGSLFFKRPPRFMGLANKVLLQQQLTCEQHCCRRATFIFCTLCILYIAQQCYAIKLYLAQFRTCPRGIKSQQWQKGLSRLNSNLCIYILLIFDSLKTNEFVSVGGRYGTFHQLVSSNFRGFLRAWGIPPKIDQKLTLFTKEVVQAYYVKAWLSTPPPFLIDGKEELDKPA